MDELVMVRTNIAIIGLGPRGLSVLERIIAHLKDLPLSKAKYIDIYLFDPQEPGAGCHAMTQPDYLLVNTVASQITQFSDESIQDSGPIQFGPSFYEWIVDNKKIATEHLSPNAYYSRALFGEYLNWVFQYLLKLCPDSINIFHHQEPVEDFIANDNGTWRLLVGEKLIDVDFIYLTTGHTTKKPSIAEKQLANQVQKLRDVNPLLNVIQNPYPIVSKLSTINQACTVAVEGAGLTACDIIAELTVGRGGAFVNQDDKLVYCTSGNEPKILLYSRTGIPLTARAINQKSVSDQYKPKLMTVERINALRMSKSQLDFEQDIQPLLCSEMSYVYYYTLIKNQYDLATANQFSRKFLNASDVDVREDIINQYVAKELHFSWNKLLNPVPQNINQQEFSAWLYAHLNEDIQNALQGNIDNPIKAACDVLRDIRDIIRLAVDFAGLTEGSHSKFLQNFVPNMNRLAVGPPYTRVAEWIALMEAGIIQFNLGPAPICLLDENEAKFTLTSSAFQAPTISADVLIKARIEMPEPLSDQSVLMQSMLDRKIVKPFKNGTYYPGGIEVDYQLNVVTPSGGVIRNIWAIGILTEGCKFYTFVVPRPGVNSTAIVDAGRAVKQMMIQICYEEIHCAA